MLSALTTSMLLLSALSFGCPRVPSPAAGAACPTPRQVAEGAGRAAGGSEGLDGAEHADRVAPVTRDVEAFAQDVARTVRDGVRLDDDTEDRVAAALRLRVQPKAGGGTLRLGYTF
ncbi:MAG: hypothetical protein KC543_11730 [Myxococcales bacterium]|nr:hypothetical protein [Myxococcales bacterium]